MYVIYKYYFLEKLFEQTSLKSSSVGFDVAAHVIENHTAIAERYDCGDYYIINNSIL
jgi:hypothetical protein